MKSGARATRLRYDMEAVTGSCPNAGLGWCEPLRDWLPWLQRAAAPGSTGGFTLLEIAEWTQGELGGPASRRSLQERIAAGQPFVLWVPASADRLGWLWGQALLAERIYDRPLREQLRAWGWRPDRLTISDDELAALARRNLGRDPAEWSGGGLGAVLGLLRGTLAGGAAAPSDQRPVPYPGSYSHLPSHETALKVVRRLSLFKKKISTSLAVNVNASHYADLSLH